MTGEVEREGDFWKVIIRPSDKILAKKVGLQKNESIKADVAIDVKTTGDKKDIDIWVANVYYPVGSYSKEDIELKLDEIVKRATDPSCPLCERFKAAMSVNEKKTILDDLMLPKPDLFTPKSVSAPFLDAIGNIIGDTLKSFELLVPGVGVNRIGDSKKDTT